MVEKDAVTGLVDSTVETTKGAIDGFVKLVAFIVLLLVVKFGATTVLGIIENAVDVLKGFMA